MNTVSSYPSLLTREESTALKGLLILLVALGHNSLIMAQTGWFPYLYSFHVYCFYIFPFVYGVDTATVAGYGLWRRLWQNIKKFYPIYFFWSFVSLVAALLTHQVTFNVWGFIRAVLWGNQLWLLAYCGFGFLWFLPTIVAVMFWRDVYFLTRPIGKWILFLFSALLWILSAIGLTNFHVAGNFCPLALIQGLFFCTSGIVVRHILLRIPVSRWSKIVAIPLFTLGVSYVYFRRYLPLSCAWLTWVIVPVIAFFAFYQVKAELRENRFLKLCGKYSLQIYLLHVFIFHFVLHFLRKTDVWTAILSYLFTLVLCGIAIVVIKKTKFVRKIIFIDEKV